MHRLIKNYENVTSGLDAQGTYTYILAAGRCFSEKAL